MKCKVMSCNVSDVIGDCFRLMVDLIASRYLCRLLGRKR